MYSQIIINLTITKRYRFDTWKIKFFTFFKKFIYLPYTYKIFKCILNNHYF